MKFSFSFPLFLVPVTFSSLVFAQQKDVNYYLQKSQHVSWDAPQKGIALLDSAIVLNPKSSEAYEARSNFKRRLHLKQEAKQDLDSAIKYANLNDISYSYKLYRSQLINLEQSNNERNDTNLNDKELLNFCNKAIAIFPDSSELYCQRSYYFQQRNKYKESIEDMKKAIELRPSPFNYFSLISFMSKSKLYTDQEILKEINKCIEQNPKDAEAFRNRAYYYKNRHFTFHYLHDSVRINKDCDSALMDFDTVVALQPQNSQYYSERAKFKQESKKYKEADILMDYKNGIDVSDKKENAYDARSKYYASVFNYQEAILNLDTAIKLERNHKYSFAYYYYIERAKLKRDAGNYSMKNILADYNKSIALRNTYSNSFLDRAKFYYSKRKYKEAIADLESALIINTKAHNNRTCNYIRAEIFKYKKESGIYSDNELLQLYNSAIANKENDFVRIYMNRSSYYFETKRYREAIADLDTIISLQGLEKENAIERHQVVNDDYLFALRAIYKSESGLYSEMDIEKDFKKAESDTTTFGKLMLADLKINYYKKYKKYMEAIALTEEMCNWVDQDSNMSSSIESKEILSLKKESGLFTNQSIANDYDSLEGGKPSTLKAQIEKATFLSSLGIYDETIKELTKLLQGYNYQTDSLMPIYVGANINKAIAEIRIGKFSDAITDANTAINLSPNNCKAYNTRGFAHYLIGNYKQAIADYSKAIDNSNKYYQPLFEYKKEALKGLISRKLTPIVSIEWMRPTADVNELVNDTFLLDGNNTSYLSVGFRLISSEPLEKDEIKICMEDKEAKTEKSLFNEEVNAQTLKQSDGTTLYFYYCYKLIKLHEKASGIKVSYHNFSSQKLNVYVKKMPSLE